MTTTRTPQQIDAEIRALRLRIRRLRAERRAAELGEDERKLLRLAASEWDAEGEEEDMQEPRHE